MKDILLVEDDPEIAKLLQLHYKEPNYKLIHTYSGKDGLEKALTGNFDLIILDLTLPDMDGMEVCKGIRDHKVPSAILMLTSKSEEIDKVLALELGADDYVTKPFGIRELMARSKALIRRAEQVPQPSPALAKEIIVKELAIDLNLRKVTLKGIRLELTHKEFDLLVLLASNPGKAFTRQELLEQVWGYTFSGYEHTVTAHINRLRIKIESDLDQPEYILTSWGIGYRFIG
ncbi:response regulator transcription factor [Mucilaginibacter polytrichastri]|uniref:Phosphate regulon transcriptional regulatory protein PhoB n=1 Tax=Mucilaginibacter polytrichastri TaxID=1302689 RepID=A0A1Q6A225_9SPHI|nr:response regulator transcription factor [Mucilaginibacter polytrichastri]OKS88067.1 Transcriptional regulatory protein walR [Mucilaginibacter polytrichastri]SFT10052.1 DNA-binding response regulator, OmpR family, contains REC and winged-helix (wHTH) domain [Mucilaginibacter polytrichastri]